MMARVQHDYLLVSAVPLQRSFANPAVRSPCRVTSRAYDNSFRTILPFGEAASNNRSHRDLPLPRRQRLPPRPGRLPGLHGEGLPGTPPALHRPVHSADLRPAPAVAGQGVAADKGCGARTWKPKRVFLRCKIALKPGRLPTPAHSSRQGCLRIDHTGRGVGV